MADKPVKEDKPLKRDKVGTEPRKENKKSGGK